MKLLKIFLCAAVVAANISSYKKDGERRPAAPVQHCKGRWVNGFQGFLGPLHCFAILLNPGVGSTGKGGTSALNPCHHPATKPTINHVI